MTQNTILTQLQELCEKYDKEIRGGTGRGLVDEALLELIAEYIKTNYEEDK